MGQFVKENAHLHTDLSKFHENFDKIDWSAKVTVKDGVANAEIEKEACEQSPYFAESLNDKIYREGFGDAGTRNASKMSLLEDMARHNQECAERNLAKIQELEKEIAHLEECLDDYDSDRVPLREKLEIATEALTVISKLTHEVGFYKEPTYEAQLASTALAAINDNFNSSLTGKKEL